MAIRRVLSIDGGGVRGMIAAVLLDALDGERRALGATRPLSDCFDLIAGTSSGALIAAGLAAPNAAGDGPRRTPAELRDLFRGRSREIFPFRMLCRIPILGRLRQFFGPLYDPSSLAAVLSDELGENQFVNLRRNLLVSAYSIDPRDAVFFRGGPDYADGTPADDFAHVSLVDAVLGSAAAPTYFPPHQIKNPKTGMVWTAVDGAIFINDPAIAAFAEAAVLFPEDDIQIVSVGAGRTVQAYPFSASRGWGFLEWLSPVGPYRTPLLSAMADGQVRAVHASMTKLIADRYQRFDYDLVPALGSTNIDDASRRNVKRLEQGALQMAEALRPRLRDLARAIG